jgi:hypothetical protein
MSDDNADFGAGPLFSPHQQGSKSLIVTFEEDAAESHVSAFRIDIATMLQGNTSLETLYIRKSWDIIKAEDYSSRPTCLLQGNQTLKTLSIYPKGKSSVDRRRRQTNGRSTYEKLLFGKSPDMDLRMK